MKNFMQMFTSWRLGNLVGRAVLVRLGLLVLAGLLAGTAWAQPANDNFVNAIDLTPYGDTGVTNGSTVGATIEPGETNIDALPVFASVWYSWTASTNETTEFDPVGSNFGTNLTIVQIFTNSISGGGITNLQFVNFGYYGFLDGTLISAEGSFQAAAGQTYYISVAGYQTPLANGAVQLNWFSSAPSIRPPNDNFANAAVLTGVSGSTNVDNTLATAEPGEPSHGGFLPSQSVWYSWTAPADGEVTLDTIGSMDINNNNLDTVLAVYTGTSLATLNQVAANDELYPFQQLNQAGQNTFTQVPGPDGSFAGTYTSDDFEYSQPFSGPSGLRFNARAGTTYYIAVDTKTLTLSTLSYPTQLTSLPYGNISLNWAYHPSGVFRFATEGMDQTGSGLPLYQCAESETSRRFSGTVNANQYDTTLHTYYTYDAPGVLVTVTRVAGSSGRVSVDYTTVDGVASSLTNGDIAAVAGVDYEPVSGTLTFDDFEMSKTILISIEDDGGTAQPNRDFSVVLSNPRLDVNETTAVSLPRLDEKSSTALVRILDVDTDPRSTTGQRLSVSTNFFRIPFQFFSEIDLTQSNGAPTSSTFPLPLSTNDPAVDTTGTTTNVFNFGATNIFVGALSTNLFAYSVAIFTNPTSTPISFNFTNKLNIFLSPGASAVQLFTNNIILSNIPASFTTNGLTFDIPTNGVYNFQKANYRVTRDITNYWTGTPITVYVNRSGTNTGAATINYRVNSFFLDNAESEDNIYFPLQPGSDYAVPDPASVDSILGRNSDFDFPGGDSGTITFPGGNNVNSQPITFTIYDNHQPGFSKDFHISLFGLVNGNPVQVGMVAETTVTVLFDDQSPPAGSVDENHNPDYAIDMVPPGNATVGNPGANGEVDTLAVLPSNKTIIGGHFSSYTSGNNTFAAPGIARLNSDGQFDSTFNPANGVPNGSFISSLAVDGNNKIVIGGNFLSFNGVQRNGIARLNANGSLDTTFNPGSGVNLNATVWSVVQQVDGTILIGGDFTSYNNQPCYHIARLNSDGSLDTTFNPGTAINSTVYAIAPQASSTTNFTVTATGNNTASEVDSTINVGAPAGTLTLNYNPQFQTNELQVFYGGLGGVLIFDTGIITNAVRAVIPFTPTGGLISDTLAIVVNPNGNQPGTNWNYNASVQATTAFQLIIGGNFTSVGGVAGQDRIARLNADGSVDATFDPGNGFNGTVFSLAIQPDSKVLVGGEYSQANGQNFNRITRLNVNGSLDTGFFCGSGTDGTVNSLTAQANGTIYVGGSFTSYNGTHRLGFARLNPDGSLDTTFLDTAYNQLAGLPRVYFDDTPGAVFTTAVQSDGNVMIGGSFNQVGGGQFSQLVRTNNEDPNIWPEPKQRDGVRNRSNVARLIGGVTPGPGNISMALTNYAANKSQSSLFVTLIRTNGFLGYGSANFSVQPGLAQSGVDYVYNAVAPIYPLNWEFNTASLTRMHGDGFFGTNTLMENPYNQFWSFGINGPSGVNVSILNNSASSGNLLAQFQLANPGGADQFYLGGQDIPVGVALGAYSVPLTIVDDDRQSGMFGFAAPSYTANGANASIGVVRTNGTYGSVQMNYATVTNGSTAIVSNDYIPASGFITFNDGQPSQSFNVTILQTNNISPVEKTVNLVLYNLNGPPDGVATFGLTNAVLRIINPNFQGFLNFSTNAYSANLSSGSIAVTVTRTVGSKVSLSVQYATTDGP